MSMILRVHLLVFNASPPQVNSTPDVSITPKPLQESRGQICLPWSRRYLAAITAAGRTVRTSLLSGMGGLGISVNMHLFSSAFFHSLGRRSPCRTSGCPVTEPVIMNKLVLFVAAWYRTTGVYCSRFLNRLHTTKNTLMFSAENAISSWRDQD
jgi:hypothetical protein